MLLRSTSAPILNSWLPQHSSRDSSPEQESKLQRRSRSLSLFSSNSIDEHTGEMLHQALSDHKETVLKSISNVNNDKNPIPRKPIKQRRSSLDETRSTRKNLDQSSTFLVERLFSSSGLGKKTNHDDRVATLESGGGKGNSGGKICTGGGVGGSGVNGGGSEEATDKYYKEMIDLDPGNPLLTGNYAKFLKEVKGDMKRAEEYCERAILGKTNDGNVLALYADLILRNHRDRKRAHSYFQQAVKMSPEDCYVQASYAKFLWDVEEDEDEGEDEEEEEQMNNEIGYVPPTTSLHDFRQRTSITASS